MLDEEAAELCNAEKHEHTDKRKNYRSEYSGENKPAFRNGGNRQTGIQETALAA